MSNQVLDGSVISTISENWQTYIPLVTHQANSQTSDDTDAFVSSSMSSASDNQGQAHVPQSALTPSVTYTEDSNQGSRYPTLVASCDNFGFVKDCIIETLNSISLSVQQHKYRVLYTQRL